MLDETWKVERTKKIGETPLFTEKDVMFYEKEPKIKELIKNLEQYEQIIRIGCKKMVYDGEDQRCISDIRIRQNDGGNIIIESEYKNEIIKR